MDISISGRVVVEPGASPPSPVLVEAGCNGAGGGRTYTDRKGRFQLNVGQRTGMAEGTLDGDSTFTCTLQASLPGYHAAHTTVSSSLDRPLLTLHSLTAKEGTLVSFADLDAPAGARNAHERGAAALRKKDWPAARAEFEKALQLYPRYAGAWYHLGLTAAEQGNAVEARRDWNRAADLDGRFLMPYERLAELAAAGAKWQEMALVTDRAVRLDPVEAPVLYLYHAIAHFNLGHMDTAEQSARRAIALDTHHQLPRAEYILGRALAHKNDYRGAREHMQRYLELLPAAPDAALVRAQIAAAEKQGGS
jgi:tetratricopeptide (TPR) repeat protein